MLPYGLLLQLLGLLALSHAQGNAAAVAMGGICAAGLSLAILL